ncbi:MAG TPA: hypothetical protein VN666_13915 [Nitrospira sp.]|nr:hypothetical protein [Nitrospira sp.]
MSKHRLLNSEQTGTKAIIPPHLRGTAFGIAASGYRFVMVTKH